MYLVDTNIWLERLLDQERSAEVGRFLFANGRHRWRSWGKRMQDSQVGWR